MTPEIPLLNAAAWRGALTIMGLALALGGMLWRGGVATGGRGEVWLLRAAAGLPLVWLLALGLGQIHGALFALRWVYVLGGLAGWGWMGVDVLRARGRIEARAMPEDASEPRGLLCWVGWIVLGWFFLLLLPPAFAPPMNYDVLEYHLGIVPHVFEQRQITPIPGIFYTAQPLGTEVLYTLAAVVEGDSWGRAPKLLQALLFVLAMLLSERAMARLGVARAVRPWLVLLVAAHPLLMPVRLECKTDLTGLVMLAGGLWAWGTLRRTDPGDKGVTWRLALLAGVFAGGALGAKWTNAGTVAAPLMLLIAAEGWRAGRVRGAIGLGMGCAVTAFTLWLPWGIWMWIRAGNPFAPFMAGLFPTEAWTPQRLEFLIATHGGFESYGVDFWSNLARRVVSGLPGVPLIAMGLAGVAIAALVQRLEASRARGRQPDEIKPLSGGEPSLATLGLLCLCVGIALLSWGKLQHAATRFLIPVMLSAAIMLAGAAQWLLRRTNKGPALMRLGLPLACFALSLGPIRDQLLVMKAYQYVPLMLGRITQAEFEAALGDATPQLFAQANALPENSRILTINEARRYPFRGGVRVTSVFDHSPLRDALRGTGNEDEVLQRLRAAGFTHVLSNEFEQARILAMHTPPELTGNVRLKALLAEDDRAGLTREFSGYTEFATEPLTPAERTIYNALLLRLRRQAVWSLGEAPAMWIAAL